MNIPFLFLKKNFCSIIFTRWYHEFGVILTIYEKRISDRVTKKEAIVDRSVSFLRTEMSSTDKS